MVGKRCQSQPRRQWQRRRRNGGAPRAIRTLPGALTDLDMLRLVGIVTTTVLAIAYFLDIYFARRKSVIYGRFLDWWYWLSNLKFQRAIHGSIAITRRGIELLCGRRILSFTGIMRSAAILGVIAAARILWFSPSNDISIQTITFVVLLVIPIIPPGVVLLMIVRLLLRSAEKQPTLNHLVALDALINAIRLSNFRRMIWIPIRHYSRGLEIVPRHSFSVP